MSLLLTKTNMQEGFIDAAIGEAFVVNAALQETFNLNYSSLISNSIYEYQSPAGYQPLVDYLENKHRAKVIITAGAKQACSAVFSLLKRKYIDTVNLPAPYWSAFIPLLELFGLRRNIKDFKSLQSYLLVSPNNPDNRVISEVDLAHIKRSCQQYNAPLIHDGAYFSDTYLPKDFNFAPIGDIQIFSLSKTYGISGLRVGYIVCHNENYYEDILHYIENTTVGVSTLSQVFALNVLQQDVSAKHLEFINLVNQYLSSNRVLIRTIDSSILDVSQINNQGIFLWTKADKNIFDDNKIVVGDGAAFGQPGFIRMNIALPTSQIKDIVNRLNSSKRK